MPSRIPDSKVSTIIELHRRGWNYSRIAAKLKLHYETVARYVRELKEPTQVVAIALYRSDIARLRKKGRSKRKSASDLVREIVHEAL